MKKENFSDSDMRNIVEDIRSRVDDMEAYMNDYYNDILFLGTSIADEEDVLEIVKYSIRVCSTYYHIEEDYKKLSELKKLKEMLDIKKISIVDKSIIDEIAVFEN